MLSRRSIVPLLLAIALVCGASPPLGAQTASVPPILAGSWTHDGAVATGMHTVERAFAPAITALPYLLQGMARDRITESLQPPATIDVALSDARVRVTLHANVLKTIDGALNAHARTSGVQEGTVVTPRVASGWLDLVYEGEDSTMHQLFSTEPDGSRMHVDYSITSERVGNVRYRLEYVRAH
jgi:hypothetical protein